MRPTQTAHTTDSEHVFAIVGRLLALYNSVDRQLVCDFAEWLLFLSSAFIYAETTHPQTVFSQNVTSHVWPDSIPEESLH